MPVHKGRKAALAILAALAMLSAACSDKDDDGGSDDGSTETTESAADVLGEKNEATGDPITIGFVTDGDASFASDENEVATFEATVQYANEYLGGINGHPIEIEHCTANATPAGSTQCAVDLIDAGVAAAVVPVLANDGTLYEGLADSGIPYFTYTSANQSILLGANAFQMTNPISQIAVPGLVAQDESIDKVGFVIIDVPAAVGPITQIATPIYGNLDVGLEVTPIAASVADMTPQLQEAISGGAGLFSVTGAEDFNINGINGLRDLGFDGPIVMGNLTQGVLDGIDSTENLVGIGTYTDDASNSDVQLMNAVVETYSDLDAADADPGAFATVLGFVRGLTGSTDAVDAATVSAALSAMPETDLPLGDGITFQCGSKPVAFAPGICSLDVLQWSFDADGQSQDFSVVTVPADVLKLG